MDNAVKPLKIFISYGHEIGALDESGKPYPEPNNESVVRKIKAYLESRGHEVWLDKDKIKAGDDWRKAIYDGVEWSDVALICLSRKAMKPNGVCLDEIAIAVGVRGGNMFPIKLEALENSEYPAYLLTHQLFTNFMDWQLHWSADKIDEAWLNENLEALANALENENVRQYGVEMTELKKILHPWDISSRLRRLDRGIQYLFNEQTGEREKKIVHKFCGRESLFKMFEDEIALNSQAIRDDAQRVLWLKKGPGFGKSRFAAELLYRYYHAIHASFFIEYKERETHQPQKFVTSIAYQLAQANSSYRSKLLNYLKENQEKIDLQTGDSQTLFKTLVLDLLKDEIDGGRASQWILVDALDEATDGNRNEIASLINHNLNELPSWIRFFITSRDNDDSVNRNFAHFTPVEFPEEENVSDVREYICSEFKGMDVTVSEELVNVLLEKSEGTFLYPEMVFRDLKKKAFTIDDIHNLPKGVIDYIHSQFERLFGDRMDVYKKEIRPMLGYILTSCEPIPRAVLKYCLEINRNSELDDRLEQLGTFFIQSGTSDEDTISAFHKSVIDYCFNKDVSGNYCIYPDEAKEDFAEAGLRLYESGALQWTTRTDEEPNTLQRYFLTWLPSHLMNADKKQEAAKVLADFPYLMKRLRFGNVERVLQDYILFRDALKGVSKNSDAYFDVICSNAHFLRRNCEDNPAYKTMLQIATEVADDCPVTQDAERWLNPETGDSPCNWFWLNKVRRPKEYQPNPCKLVIENAGNKVLLLSNGDALSWGFDENIYIWDLKTGVCKAVLEGHTDDVDVIGAVALRSGDILSWSDDKTLRIWSSDGTCKSVLKGHIDNVYGVIELSSGDILSWCGTEYIEDDIKDYTLRLWSPDGTCKAVLEGHAWRVEGTIELRSGDILSWSGDKTLRLWSPDGTCKAVLEGHSEDVSGAIELSSGDILSWSLDGTLRLWSPDGTCKAVLEGHSEDVSGAIELSSGDILSWSDDTTLRLWSPDGTCKVLEGHTGGVNGAIELSSGDILSWGYDTTLRLWSPDGTCKAVLEGHTSWVIGALELRSGDILSWSGDKTLRLWSPDGTCKAVLEGHSEDVSDAIELRSGDILSWSGDKTLRLWSPDGTCKAVLEGHTASINGVRELNSGDILSWSFDATLRLWSPDGICKAVLEGHTIWVYGAIELRSGDILSWSNDRTLCLWSPDGKCKAVLEGHTDIVNGAIELRSGDILSWSDDDTSRLWSPDGTCKAVLEGHTDHVWGAIELSSGDILSWSYDNTLRLWSPDGTCKAVLDGHTSYIKGAIVLRSGDILSWSDDNTLRLWSLDGTCKAVMEGHTGEIWRTLELRSGDILSWSYYENTLRLWSPDGTCKAVLEGHTDHVWNAIELSSGDILSWSNDKTLRLWSLDGTCKAVMEGHTESVWGAIELSSGDILSWSLDETLRLWSPDGKCKEVIDSKKPQFASYYSLLHKEWVHGQYFVKKTDWGIELQHDFKPITRWNSPSCKSRFLFPGRICVWYGHYVEFLQLNYGNHMSVSFDQAHQFLTGEIDESQLVTYVPEPQKPEIPQSEPNPTAVPAQTKTVEETFEKTVEESPAAEETNDSADSAAEPKRGFFSWLFGRK